MNMKQGVAKKGAGMLFPWINRGGDGICAWYEKS